MDDKTDLSPEARDFLIERARVIRRQINTGIAELKAMEDTFGIRDDDLIVPRMARRKTAVPLKNEPAPAPARKTQAYAGAPKRSSLPAFFTEKQSNRRTSGR